ncbi:MAG: hypothetical protein V4667_12565 [Bacteroidota bacterium]
MFKNILNTVLTKGISAVCNFVVAVFISNYLGAEGKGEASLLITNVAVVMLFVNFFGGATLAYLVAKYNSIKVLKVAFLFSFLIVIVSFFLFFIFTNNLFLVINCSVLSIIIAISTVFQNFLIGKNKVSVYNLVLVSQSVILLMCVLIGFNFNVSLNVYLFALYFSYFISLFIAVFFYLKYKSDIAENTKVVEFKEILSFGFQNQISHVLNLFLMRSSYYFLIFNTTNFEVGVFSNALIVVEGIWLFAMSFSTVQYAKIINSTRIEAVDLTLFLMRISFYISGVIWFILICMPSTVFVAIFGEDFNELKNIIVYLGPGIILYNFSIIIGHFFSGTGKFKINTYASLISVLCGFVFLGITINTFNIKNAIVFHNITYIVTTACLILFFIRETKTKFVFLFYNKNDFSMIKNSLKR